MAPLSPVPPGREHWVVSPEQHAAEFVAGLRSPATRTGYRGALRRWLAWCEEAHLDPWAVDRRHIEAWLATQPAGTAPGAATAVCSFYRDAHDMGLTREDLARGVRRPRRPSGPRGTWATVEEMRRMLDLARRVGGDTWALLAILTLMGARSGETVALDVDDVLRDHGAIQLRFHRKRQIVDVVACPPGVIEALGPLLARRRTGPLLRNQHGNRMTSRQAQERVRDLGRRAGCEQPISPHSLRRSFITAAWAAGATTSEIMAVTGHRDPGMVEHYIRGARQQTGDAAVIVDRLLGGDQAPE
ncbi:hypothetical protein CSPHI_05105 [Corynebacterium sphenisci DSM 44792]|uniref:Integrase n=1 Tax=Corynebacterium sphenisci DSM 44792 TaxID=1437874 RepID=A0A1L7CXC2_9CORY|nr:site-specific integrase [Corynebacterium sphenisci]APT90516.1 hypothetical protein CSPHI_05105 [Corynebacterium sphenisci DSM 44792]